MISVVAEKREFEKCTLDQWIQDHHTEEEMGEVFLYMDVALKYIHDHGYCIEVFHPSRIEILDNDPKKVQFVNLMEMPADFNMQSQYIKDDIFNSSFIQIGYYTNTLNYLKPDFLIDNFDEIARFVPEGFVPYYRGVVQRGNAIYLSEFSAAKAVRDLEELEQQLQSADGDIPAQRESSQLEPTPITNNQVNNQIYKQISGFRDAAFVSYLLVPTVLLISLLLLAFFGWVISLF